MKIVWRSLGYRDRWNWENSMIQCLSLFRKFWVFFCIAEKSCAFNAEHTLLLLGLIGSLTNARGSCCCGPCCRRVGCSEAFCCRNPQLSVAIVIWVQDATVEIKNKENGNMRGKLLVHKSCQASCGLGCGRFASLSTQELLNLILQC